MPEDMREWVGHRAEELDVDRQTVLGRAVAAYRYLEEETDGRPAAADADAEALAARIEELESRLAAAESEFGGKLDDVRERVIQVKREADGKADADHDHRELDRRTERALRAATDTRVTVAALDDRVEDGFENFEEILEYLTETADDHDARLTALAKAHLDLQSQVAALEAARSGRTRTDDIREAANRHGATRATCEACGENVHVGLLGSPRCPHCETPLDGFEPSPGLFHSATLTAGERPALEGESGAGSVEDLLTVEGDDDE